MRHPLDDHENRALWEQAGFKVERDYYSGRDYRIGLDMDPHDGQYIDGVACPCAQGHQLTDSSSPLVFFRGRVWAYSCALKESVLQCANVMLEILRKRSEEKEKYLNVSRENAQTIAKITELATILQSKLINHADDCNAINPAAAMRGRNMCTCDYEELKAQLETLKW